MSDPFRVDTLEGFVGQPKMKQRLSIHVQAALMRGERLPHVLLTGPPGSGKTSISGIIAQCLDQPFGSFIMPYEDRLLQNIVMGAEGNVILLDELHRCSRAQQENMLTLIESNYLQLKTGRRLENYVTIIGATTERDKIITPLYDRFPIKPDFEEYTDEELGEIVAGMAKRVGVDIDIEDAKKLGRASGGVPRNAKRLVVAFDDIQNVNGSCTVEDVLEMCQITEDGLEVSHIKLLRYLQKNAPTGLNVLSTILELGESAVRNLERLLLRKRLIMYTKGGRELTPEGHAWLRNAR